VHFLRIHFLMCPIAKYTENDCSLLRSKIRQLHPVQRDTLGALLRHLLRVVSHSDKNAMTVEMLANCFWYNVLRGYRLMTGDVCVKTLFMEDLIQNAHTLFDERLSPFPPESVLSTGSTSDFRFSSATSLQST